MANQNFRVKNGLDVGVNGNIITTLSDGKVGIGSTIPQKNLDVLEDLLVGGDARIVGVLTVGSSSLTLDGSNNQVKVGTALTLGHSLGLQFHTQNLHADGFEINNINVGVALTVAGATDLNGNLDVDGTTELDVVNISDNVSLASDKELNVGSSALQLKYVSSSQDALIRNTNASGTLLIDTAAGSSVKIANSTGGESMGVFNTDGSVELYHNNLKKFETTSTGAIITGVATATSFVASSGNFVGNLTGNVTGNADTATTATNAQGLTGTPDITVSNVSAGIVTGTAFHTGAEGSAIRVTSSTISGPATLTIDPGVVGDNTGTVVIAGNLQVDGTQTTVNSTNITIDDKNLVLASGAASQAATNDGGLIIDAPTQVKWVYNQSNDAWDSTENINLAASKKYRINGIGVLSANTLGSGVVNSSLTSVGTLSQLNVTGIVTASGFAGPLTGDVSGTATNASNINISAITSTDTTLSVVMVGAEATGNQPPIIDGGLKYNAVTNNLTANGFAGDLLLADAAGNVLVVGSGVGQTSQLYNTNLYDSLGRAITNVTADAVHFAGDADGLIGSPDIAVTNVTAGIVTASTGFAGNLRLANNAGNVLIVGAGAGSTSQLYNTNLYNSLGQPITEMTAGQESFGGNINVNSGLSEFNNVKIVGLSTDGSEFGTVNYVPVADGSGGWDWKSQSELTGAGISGITVKEEGTDVGTTAGIKNVNFVGSNITASATGDAATITLTNTPTFTNSVKLESDDGSPARLDLYCEVSNAHYTRLQAPAHSTYSGNNTITLPVVSGTMIIGGTNSNSVDIKTTGNIDANTIKKTGGTSDQFLKADGSVDTNNYLTSYTETNDLSTAVTWANVPNANITQSSVTQHQGALSITESQISDLGSYLTSYTETNDLSSAVTWVNVPNANITQSSVTQHQAALSITESQISDLGSYLTSYTETDPVVAAINGIVKSNGTTIAAAVAGTDYVSPNGTADIITTGKILYANMYATTGDLPSATTYHGMFAHVHATGKGYFAHGGNWIELMDENSTISYTETQTLDDVLALGNTTTRSMSAGSLTLSDTATAPSLKGYNYLQSDKNYQSTTTFVVTVGTKTADHRYNSGSSLAYLIDGEESPHITLVPGKKYRFDQSDPTNNNHDLRFYVDAARVNQWGASVNLSGTMAGQSGSYVEIIPDQTTPPVLYYQCVNHAYMGSAVSVDTGRVYTDQAATFLSSATANSFIKSGGSSSQFLKADGSVDSSTYLTSYTETNDLSSSVTWTNVPSANITQASVTQHQAALSITESQISDLGTYLTSVSASNLNSISIDALSDVDTSTVAPTNTQVLKWNASSSKWLPGDASVVGSIDDLSDVDTTTSAPTDGQALVWDNANSKWEPGTIDLSSKIGLSDLSVTTASAGTASLSYNSASGAFTYTPPDLSSYLTSIGALSINALSDVDTTTNAPNANDVLSWNGSKWIPATQTTFSDGDKGDVVVSSSGSTFTIDSLAVTTAKIADDAVTAAKLADTAVTAGTYSSADITVDAQGRITSAADGGLSGLDLQAVTSNGATSTHAISAAGFKLNSTYTSSVSGTSGDIKKIGGLPFFHDGSSWKQFYLFGTTAAVTTPDISWEDVQVRMDFETGALFNYVNGRTASTLTDATPNTQNISVVSSPVKFGTKSLKIKADDGDDGLYWEATNLLQHPSTETLDYRWSGQKRGGSIDWSTNWTVELHVNFNNIPSGDYSSNQLTGGAAIFSVKDTANTDETFGLVVTNDSFNNKRFVWVNTRKSTNVEQTLVTQSSVAFGSTNVWKHIAVTRDASAGKVRLHVDGTYLGEVTDTDLIALNSASTHRTIFGSMKNTGSNAHDIGSDIFIDDLRITQAKRYDVSTNFTAPSVAYATSAAVPAVIDSDWDNVLLRLTFDQNFNDISSNGTTGTANAITTIQNANVKYGGGSARFQTGDSYVSYGQQEHLDFSGTWTVDMWVNFDQLPANGDRMILWSSSHQTTNTNNIEFGIRKTSTGTQSIKFYWKNAQKNSGAINDLNFDTLYDAHILDGWHHVALVREPSLGKIELYLDGYKMRFASNGGYFTDTDVTADTTHFFWLGWVTGNPINTDSLDGFLDDFRVTSDVRYTTNFTPPTGPLSYQGTTGGGGSSGGGGGSSYADQSGIATVSRGLMGTPDITVRNITAGIVTGSTFIGDGSGLTGVVGEGSGVAVRDSGSIVGTATTIDFGANLAVSAISSGIVTVTAQAGASLTVKQEQGNGGTEDVSVSSVSTLIFDANTGFNVTDNGSGEVFVDLGSSFSPWYVDGQADLHPDGEEAIEIIAGTGIALTTKATSNGIGTGLSKALTISATGIGLGDLSVATAAPAASSQIAYDNTTGVFTFTPVDLSAKIEKADLSVTTASAGTAALTYDNTNGQFTYTPPDLSSFLTSETQTLNQVLANGNATATDIISTGKIYYGNMFATIADLPSATTYHGMFAHVHGTGKGYFAHAGNWVELLDTASSIDKLSDVDTSTVAPTDGQVLAWDNTAGKWEPSDGSSVASIDDLGDVDTTTNAPTADQTLVWNAATQKWNPANRTGIALTSISATTGSAANPSTLTYDNTTGIFNYTPPDITSLGSIDHHSDVDTTTTAPTNNQVLTWNSTDSKWEPADVSTTASGPTSVNYGASFPTTGLSEGGLFYNSTYGKIFVRFDGYWVDASPNLQAPITWTAIDSNMMPLTDNTYDVGSFTKRWRNIYTTDLNLSNEGKQNDVDGSWGKWTIQEGEDDLFIINRRNGKKYRFGLTEVN